MRSNPSFKRYVDYLVYLAVRLLEEAFNLLPERVALAVGGFLGRVGFVLLPDRRAAVIENLTIAFGREKDRRWIRRTAAASFEHIGLLAVEFFRIRRWSQKEMAERIEIVGRDSFNLTMQGGMHGVVLLNSHFGCFEVSAATVKFLGFNLHLVQTGMKNPFINQYFLTRGGDDTGIRTYPHRGIVKKMIDLLQEGELVAVLADQRGDAERGVFVDYFGTPAPANEVFAKIAIEGEGRVMPLCTYRIAPGRYRSIFEDEIRITLTGDQRADLLTVSQQFHTLFEKWMRVAPEQGFWVQRKWRRKPSRKRSKGAHR